MSLASHVHDHNHHHDHLHGPDHSHGARAGHEPHAHHHDDAAPHRADPGLSLLRMSSAQRLLIALALVAAIWLGVFWAWS